MIKTGNDVMFQEPTCSTRRLRRSVVVEAGPDRFSIQFVAEPFGFEVGQEVLMYFMGSREFMQQIGRVEEITEAPEGSSEGPTFTLAPVGDAISAESRQHYRVSTISAGIEARVGDEHGLSVQDLSSTGFAVVARERYEIGQTVQVEIAHEDEQCHGIASIQSIREFGPERIRYGMRAIDEDPHTGEFLEVLQRISLAIQREQLQRGASADD